MATLSIKLIYFLSSESYSWYLKNKFFISGQTYQLGTKQPYPVPYPSKNVTKGVDYASICSRCQRQPRVFWKWKRINDPQTNSQSAPLSNVFVFFAIVTGHVCQNVFGLSEQGITVKSSQRKSDLLGRMRKLRTCSRA